MSRMYKTIFIEADEKKNPAYWEKARYYLANGEVTAASHARKPHTLLRGHARTHAATYSIGHMNAMYV